MKALEKIFYVVILGIFLFSILRGCSSQSMTKNWGGEMNVPLEPNQKLVEVTWKEDNLWFLTRQMSDDDIAESYQFYEKDTLGILEGCVNIYERKLSDEELDYYNNQKTLADLYYNPGNMNYEGEPIFIEYDINSNEYKLLQPYEIEDGVLVPQ